MRVLPILVVLLLSGCFSNGDGDDQAGGQPIEDRDTGFGAVQALLADVPCSVDSVNQDTSENLKLLTNVTVGASDIDIREHLLATTSAILDISDPLQPVILGNYSDFEIGGGGDVKFMPDNQSVVLGGGSVQLVNIADPWNYFVEDEWTFDEFGGPLPSSIGSPFLNAHMLYTARIADQDWVFVAPNSNTGIWILRADGEVGSRDLVYVAQTLPIEGGPLGPHDMYVQKDALTSDWYLYSADGYHGWTVFNINDPSSPQVEGGFFRPESGYTHTIQAAQIGERRIVATIQEVGVNFMEVYDATILQAPILLATWQVGAGETTPQHNFNIVNGTLYLAHYSFGMYVFDLDDAGSLPVTGSQTLIPIAHYDPAPGGIERPVPLSGEFEAVYDVVLKDGILYIGGFSSPVEGVHIVGFGCITPGDTAQTSTG